MKRILTAGALSVAIAVGCAAQSIVKMPLGQNPLFEVSTDRVALTMPADGGGLILGGNVVVTGGSGSYTYRWYTPAGAELGSESTFQATSAGVYMLDITDSCDCLQTVEFNLASAGIESTVIPGLKIGPNPTSGPVTSSGFDAVRISAVDMSGRLVNVTEHNGNVINNADFSMLPSGEYVLTLGDADGKTVVYRMIKQ